MKLRRWPIVILMLVALAIPSVPLVAAAPAEQSAEQKVIVYYFHGNKRCKTCRTIEAYAGEALASRFSTELDSGLLEWKVVNFDEPENEHFLEEFGLYSSSVVVVEREGGRAVRHEILPEVWSLVREKQSFFAYLNTAVRKYLE